MWQTGQSLWSAAVVSTLTSPYLTLSTSPFTSQSDQVRSTFHLSSGTDLPPPLISLQVILHLWSSHMLTTPLLTPTFSGHSCKEHSVVCLHGDSRVGVQLPYSKDAVGMSLISLPHIHNRFSCPGGGSFTIPVIMIIGVGRRFHQAGMWI